MIDCSSANNDLEGMQDGEAFVRDGTSMDRLVDSTGLRGKGLVRSSPAYPIITNLSCNYNIERYH